MKSVIEVSKQKNYFSCSKLIFFRKSINSNRVIQKRTHAINLVKHNLLLVDSDHPKFSNMFDKSTVPNHTKKKNRNQLKTQSP